MAGRCLATASAARGLPARAAPLLSRQGRRNVVIYAGGERGEASANATRPNFRVDWSEDTGNYRVRTPLPTGVFKKGMNGLAWTGGVNRVCLACQSLFCRRLPPASAAEAACLLASSLSCLCSDDNR